MEVSLHKSAMTAPTHRAPIQRSAKSAREIARCRVTARSYTRHRLHSALSQAQRAIAVELQRTLDLNLDNLVFVAREFINLAAYCLAIQRLIRRHGLSRLATGDDTDKPPVDTSRA